MYSFDRRISRGITVLISISYFSVIALRIIWHSNMSLFFLSSQRYFPGIKFASVSFFLYLIVWILLLF